MFKRLVIILASGLTPVSVAAQEVDPARITVEIVPGITNWKQLPTPELVNARRAMTEGRSVYTADLRALADLGDGLAALRFAQLLEEQDHTPREDIAHYYGMGAATGRGGAINGLIRILDGLQTEELSDARRLVLRDILITYAMAGNEHAIKAIMRYQLARAPLGVLDDEIVNVLDGATGEGAAQLAIQAAVTIQRDPDATTRDLLQAREYLQIATTGTALRTQIVAQNMAPLLDARLQAQPDLEVAPAEVSDTAAEADILRPQSRPSFLTEVSQ